MIGVVKDASNPINIGYFRPDFNRHADGVLPRARIELWLHFVYHVLQVFLLRPFPVGDCGVIAMVFRWGQHAALAESGRTL